VLTPAITPATAAILSLFGIKPGPYLVVVAVVVKIILVAIGLFLAMKVSRRRAAAALPADEAKAPADPKTS
jgi:hypothetical protein